MTTPTNPADEAMVGLYVPFLLALADRGCTSDVGEMLVQGDGKFFGPGALRKAIAAISPAIREAALREAAAVAEKKFERHAARVRATKGDSNADADAAFVSAEIRDAILTLISGANHEPR